MSVTSRLKATKIIGREFQSLAVQGRNCWRRHPCNIYEWWLKNHAIYQNNELTFLKKKEVEPVQPVLKNIYESNTYRKDLS